MSRHAIHHRPTDLSWARFRELDAPCFPTEPMKQAEFEAVVGLDFWAAFDSQGALDGYGYLKAGADVGWIARIAVHEAQRRQGLGSRLMEVMLDRCRELGLATVILYVMQDNRPAIRLYEKYGFEVSDETAQYVASLDPSARGGAGRLQATPLPDVPAPERPAFEGQWSDLPRQHRPPKTWLLVFRTPDGRTVGHCRLAPGFPGCFPFVLVQPADQLADALEALRPYLSPNHDILKLTFSDPLMDRACAEHGLRLKYRLFRMTAPLRSAARGSAGVP